MADRNQVVAKHMHLPSVGTEKSKHGVSSGGGGGGGGGGSGGGSSKPAKSDKSDKSDTDLIKHHLDKAAQGLQPGNVTVDSATGITIHRY